MSDTACKQCQGKGYIPFSYSAGGGRIGHSQGHSPCPSCTSSFSGRFVTSVEQLLGRDPSTHPDPLALLPAIPSPAPKIGEKYRHFKGHEYEVVDLGKHTETLETLVVYRDVTDPNADRYIRPLYGPNGWTTPKDGVTRFVLIST